MMCESTAKDPGGSAWDSCPADVLLGMFKYMDINSIAQCYSVNQWWRNMVDYWAQHNDNWSLLASELIPNYGSTFIQKSLLDWKELYHNYLLWQKIDEAKLKYDCQLTIDGIQYLHIYKDLVTVVPTEKRWTSMDMLRVNESGFQNAVKTKEKETCTNLVQEIINAGPFLRIAFPTDQSSTEDVVFYTLAADNNIAYNSWNKTEDNRFEFHSETICKLYDTDNFLDDFQLVENFKDEWQKTACLYRKNASVLFVDCSLDRIGRMMRGSECYNRPHFMMHAEKIFRPTAPAQLLFSPDEDFEFTNVKTMKRKHEDDDGDGTDGEDDEDEWATQSGSSCDYPFSDANESFVENDEQLEADCLTVYNSGKRFVGLSLDVEKHLPYAGYSHADYDEDADSNCSGESGDTGSNLSSSCPSEDMKASVSETEKRRKFIARCVRWVGSDGALTSATQHGDMLLLGYLDGKIEIHKVNFEVVADTSPAKLVFNIKDYIPKDLNNANDDYSVLVIEVYEVKHSHCLLIATPNKLHRINVTYSENIKRSVGVSAC